MSAFDRDPDHVLALVEEVVRSGIVLTDVLGAVLEGMPEDAFPGEDAGEVLLDMVAGSVRPAAEAAGEQVVREATALVGAIVDRTIADLRAAIDDADG